MLLWGAGLVALAAGVRAYNYLTSSNLLLDPLYELRLRRLRLDELDRRRRANPRRSPIVVSLTTTPSRIGLVALTLKSLLNQTLSPAAIRLLVPERSRREKAAYAVPEAVARLRGIEIVRCRDYGPATKLIPSLLALDPDQPILAVDDDRIYHPRLVERLDALVRAHPDVAIGASGWQVPEDLLDRPTTLVTQLRKRPPVPFTCAQIRKPEEVDVLQGFSGYVVRPRFFDLDRLSDYSGAPEAAVLADDVWISAHCRAPKVVFPMGPSNFQSWLDGRFYRATSLGLVNRGDGTLEGRSNTIAMRHCMTAWRVSGRGAARPGAGA
jgi:hypothetical protein